MVTFPSACPSHSPTLTHPPPLTHPPFTTPAVLYARDKWLAPGGLIFPDKATMYMAGIEDGDYKAEKMEFWNSVYGYDMSCIRDLAMLEPLVDTVNGEAVNTDHCRLWTCDIATVQKDDLTFSCPFSLTMKRSDYVHAFVAWFDIEFRCVPLPLCCVLYGL